MAKKQGLKKPDAWIIILLIVTGVTITCGYLSTTPASDAGKTVTAAPADAGVRIITEEFPPFNYAGPDGKATGLATDIVNGILTRLNQKAEIEILPWSEGYSNAIDGPKIALYSTVRTDEREHLFEWVGPVASYDYMFFAKRGSGLSITSLDAVRKAGTIGVVKDDARHQFLLQNRFENILTCETDAGCLRNLTSGKTDLWLGSSVSLAAIAQKEGIDASSFKGVYSVRTVPLYIAFSNDTSDSVITGWKDALDAMKRDGTFDSIQRKYGVSTPAKATVAVSAGKQADLALTAMIAETDGRLKIVLRTFEVLVITPDVKTCDWKKIKPLLSTLETKEPGDWMWYANPDGSYYTVVDGLTTANIKSRSYFPFVLGGNESVGTVVVSKTTGRNVAVVAVPVKENEAVTCILGASVYLDTLTDTLRSKVPEPFVFYAIDREGKFAIHSDKGQISRDIETISPGSSFGKALRWIRTKESGTVMYDDGGIRYQATFRTSDLTGWRFVVAWPKSA